MSRGILIAGNDSSLVAALSAETERRVERFALALIPGRAASRAPETALPPQPATRLRPEGTGRPPQALPQALADAAETGPRIPLEWNPGSPISARALVLGVENRLEHIDLAILVCSPPSLRRPPDQLAPADVEFAVNNHIKGWFFLAREITAAFTARREGSPTGTLAMVLADYSGAGEKGESPDLIGPSVAASFRSLAQGILVSQAGRPWQAMAFSSEASDDREFAAFIFKTIDEGGKRVTGKWHKYGRFPLFGR